MLLFCGEGSVVVIPSEKIYNIQQINEKIIINYDGGEITWLDDSNFVPKVETKILYFDSAKTACERMRCLYLAGMENQGAFYF